MYQSILKPTLGVRTGEHALVVVVLEEIECSGEVFLEVGQLRGFVPPGGRLATGRRNGGACLCWRPFRHTSG